MARADGIVARWIQLAPGSSAGFPTITDFGDAPTSLTNTVLARAIVADGVCPSLFLDHAVPIAMLPRFAGSTLAGTAVYPTVTGPAAPLPGSAGKSNGKPGYPQYFIDARATEASRLPGPSGSQVAQATSAWTECEAIVPAGHDTATIGGVDLKLPLAHPRRILVMADTGCRMNGTLAANGANEQNCERPDAFPLQFLASYEAAFQPDLIIQVGDWFYRDTNCTNGGAAPEPFAGCASAGAATAETWGDTFDSWNADLFYPAKSLLAAAPWVMVRGNHESCGRGARGWYALLDPKPYDATLVRCAATGTYPNPGGTADAPEATYTADFEPTYLVPLGDGVTLLVHDSSFANDSAVDVPTAKNYDIDLTHALAAVGAGGTSIFVTHKPTTSLTDPNTGSATAGGAAASYPGGVVANNNGDITLQAVFYAGTYAGSAFRSGVPASIGLFLSGHVHQLQYTNPQSVYPPQLVVGTGGSLLDADMNTGNVPDGFGATYVTMAGGLVRAPLAGYTQLSGPGTTWSFTVGTLPAPYTTPGSASVTFSHNYSLDEFGFAVLDAVDAGGQTTGYVANTYKISSSNSGRCAITLGNRAGQTRGIFCNF